MAAMQDIKNLQNWLLERMAAYKGGGVPYSEAARWTLGEIRALYSGDHYQAGGKKSPKPRLDRDIALTESKAILEAIKEGYNT